MSIRLQAHVKPRPDTRFTPGQSAVLTWADQAIAHVLDPNAPVPEAGENLLVLAGPATGKTTLATEIAARAARAFSERASAVAPIAVLAATRERAAALSGQLAHRLGGLSAQVQVKTPTALAFAIAEQHARAAWAPGDAPIPSPELLTGPEQDALIAEILSDDAVLPATPGSTASDTAPDTALDTALGGASVRNFVLANRATPAFRTEVRDLLTRAEELGLNPPDVAALGERAHMPLWGFAARMMAEYRRRVISPELRGRYDHATLLRLAIDIISTPPESNSAPEPTPGEPEPAPAVKIATPPQPTYSLIIADDYQDFTLGALRLIGAMRAASTRAGALLLASPDTASQQYRGGSGAMVGRASEKPQPLAGEDALGRAENIGRFAAGVITLHETFDLADGARALYDVTSQHVGAVGAGYRRKPSWHPQRVIRAAATPGNEDIPAARGRELSREQWQGATVAERAHIRATMLPAGVDTFVAHSPEQESAEIASVIRRQHLRDGRPLSDFAVITRTAAYGQAIREQLAQAGIAVAIPGRPQVLRESPACIPLFNVARWALDNAIDPHSVTATLTSYLGGLPVGELLNLQRWLNLRFAGIPGTASASREELIIRAITEGEGDTPSSATISAALDRLRRAFSTARTALADGGGPAEVFWEIWQVADVAEKWADLAISGSASHALDAVRAEEYLDAVMALFRDIDISVQRSEQRVGQLADERSGAAQLAVFLRRQAELDLPEDSIAARGHYPDSVQVITAAAAAGKRWPVVIIAGVNEGMWPSTTPYDATVETDAFTELATGILSASEVRGLRASSRALRTRRERAMDNELRQFLLAISRPSEKLYLLAVSCDATSPSIFMSFTQPPAALIPEPGHAALSGPAVIAQLRLLLEESDTTEAERAQAADLLAELAAHHVRGAHPDQWMGVTEIPSGGVAAHADQVRVRPSSIEALLATPLIKALDEAGAGTRALDPHTVDPRISGTIFHDLAERIEPISLDQPCEQVTAAAQKEIAALTRAYLGEGDSVARKNLTRDQKAMTERWVRFARARRKADNVVVHTEIPVRATVDSPGPGPFDVFPDAPELVGGPVAISSRLDRVEIRGGQVVILDIKTAGQALPAGEVAKNPQLMLYQFLWATRENPAGDLTELAGAALVYPKVNVGRIAKDAVLAGENLEETGGPRVRVQAPLEDLDEVRALIWQAAAVLMMARPPCIHVKGAYGVADQCAYPRLCPLSIEGQGIL